MKKKEVRKKPRERKEGKDKSLAGEKKGGQVHK